MNKKKFISLLKSNEGLKLDFKLILDLSTETGKKELAKDICALANSRGGRGYLIIGVEDKTKRIIGIEKDSITEEQLQQIITSRCEPPIPIGLEFIEHEDKNLAIITVFQSNLKPFQVRENGAFYIRRGSTTDTMRKQELITSFQESMNINIELAPVVKSNPEDLDVDLINKYYRLHGIECTDTNRLSLMENTKIIYLDEESKRYNVTLGGLIVFSKINYLYLPYNLIRIINNVDNNNHKVHIIQGDLLSMLKECNKTLGDILPKNYPKSAVYEAIKNAVLYRDYTIINKEIEIIVGNSSVSVTSPGVLLKENKGSMEVSNDYLRRNMWIYEKIITLGEDNLNAQTRKGFFRMKKDFKKFGDVIFVNSYKDNIFKVIFPGINKIK
ncbi:divergent AAA domain protein [Clostridium homopropionicum DSM 5847]|uniref:Divergent AAA domain protein n=1 Tax=Clostridium homopropionicum DSM 5847 TaxID=1121318 RepID=A0A0L6ZCU6_9CLOT|nr:RNA-binding domain-containing protein [Clostridium homopropionicum]KOA20791.1 divergent AAA domain protein [Clostridium homopropionicum DSM 5847]SFF89065.1 Putative DNA-binding domain-containing protein [Clostridium homopropionicum]